MRETRFLFTTVRAVLRRMRFFACGVLSINSSVSKRSKSVGAQRHRSSRIARGQRINVRILTVQVTRTLAAGCSHSQTEARKSGGKGSRESERVIVGGCRKL